MHTLYMRMFFFFFKDCPIQDLPSWVMITSYVYIVPGQVPCYIVIIFNIMPH